MTSLAIFSLLCPAKQKIAKDLTPVDGFEALGSAGFCLGPAMTMTGENKEGVHTYMSVSPVATVAPSVAPYSVGLNDGGCHCGARFCWRTLDSGLWEHCLHPLSLQPRGDRGFLLYYSLEYFTGAYSFSAFSLPIQPDLWTKFPVFTP